MIRLIEGDTQKIICDVESADLQSYVATMTIKKEDYSNTLTGNLVGDSYLFDINKEETANLKAGDYQYNVVIENAEERHTIIVDNLIIDKKL